MVTRQGSRQKTPPGSFFDHDERRSSVARLGRATVESGRTKKINNPPSSHRRSMSLTQQDRIEQGRKEERESNKTARHEVLESFREETRRRGRRSRSLNRMVLRRRKRSSSRRHIPRRGISAERKESDSSHAESSSLKIQVIKRRTSERIEGAQDRRNNPPSSRCQSLSTVHSSERGTDHGKGVSFEDSVALGDAYLSVCSPLLMAEKSIETKGDRPPSEELHGEIGVDSRGEDIASRKDGISRRSKLWSRLRCKSHATEEKSPNIKISGDEDGSEEVDSILLTDSLAMALKDGPSKRSLSKSRTDSNAAITQNLSQASLAKRGTVKSDTTTANDSTNWKTVIAITELLERQIHPLEVGHVMSALAKLRADALYLSTTKSRQSLDSIDRCDGDGITSAASWPIQYTVGDGDWLDQMGSKLFGGWDYLEDAENGVDKVCDAFALNHL